MFRRFRRIGPLAIIIVMLDIAACKQRTPGAFGNTKITPEIPKIDIQPVDTSRVEELKILFKTTLDKVNNNPEAAKKSIGSIKIGANARPKTYIVRLRPSAPFMLDGENPDTPLLAAGGVVKKRLDIINAVTAEFPAATDENYMLAVGKFLTDSLHILSVEPDVKVKAINSPNDPRFTELWGLNSTSDPRVDIRAVNSWTQSTGSASVVVGIVDTGIDYNHQDLSGNIWQNPGETGLDAQGRDKRTNKVDDDGNGFVDDFRGWDFANNDNDPMDENNHGTHVAGTIGATGNNGVGVVGVNWTVKMAPLRFLDANGEGYISDAISATQYATKMRFFATNHSWGGGDYSQAMFDAIKAANVAGQLFVAAAGNESLNNDSIAHYPSDYQLSNVISVAAVTKTGTKASFSNYGRTKVHVGAPGVGILSTTIGNSYASYQGTSMATPHVTGLAALLKSANPNITALEVRTRILNSVTTLTGLANFTVTGGIINAEAALGYLKDTSPPNPPTGLSVVWRALSRAKVSWTAATDSNQGGVIKGYELRYGTSAISNTAAWQAATPLPDALFDAAGTSVSASFALPSGFSGFLAVRSVDGDDNLSPLTSSIAISLLPVAQVASYSGDSMDGVPKTPWVIETDGLRGKVFSDGVGNYPARASRHLKLPSIPLRSFDSLLVKFWHRLDIENDYDKGYLTVESNVADSERVVATYSKKIGDWQYVEFDLSSQVALLQQDADAASVTIGFRLYSDSSVQADGWYVDDIEVVGTPSLLTISGVPASQSAARDYSISISQTAEQSAIKIDNYQAAFQQGTIKPCGVVDGLVSRQVSAPSTGSIPELGKSVFCLLAPVKDYVFTVQRYYAWNRVAENPSVASLSGFPSGVSNKSTVTGSVAGTNVAFYSYFVASDDEQACDTATFTAWAAISAPLTIQITKGQKTILCVKGKGSQGELQSGYTKVSWVSDFTAPTAIITGEAPVSSLKSVTSVTVSGQDVTGYQFATGATADACGSFSATLPLAQKINLSIVVDGDGERRLCVKGVDLAGNVQIAPTVLTWTQDTVAQPVGFSGLPASISNIKNIAVTALASEPGQYRYTLKSGTVCDLNALQSAPLRSLSQGITDALPLLDGPYTLCAVLIDSLGNVQKTPTQYTWTKDTAPPVANLTNLPAAKTAAMTISVSVAGEGVTSYKYTTTVGTMSCDPSAYKVKPIGTPISETFLNRGVKKLCVAGIDAAGNVQSTPIVYSWEIVTAPILTAGLLRVPPSPNSKRLLNIGITSPSGQNITSYRYGFAPGFPGNCARMSSWSSYRSISVPITDNLGSYQGYRTLCVMGKNKDGFEQMTPTMATWFKIDGAQASPPVTLFGRVSLQSKTSSSVSFRVTRNVITSAQTIRTKVCPISGANGSINSGACKSRSASFAARASFVDVSEVGLSGGSYVIIVLPSSNRVDPITFDL